MEVKRTDRLYRKSVLLGRLSNESYLDEQEPTGCSKTILNLFQHGNSIVLAVEEIM